MQLCVMFSFLLTYAAVNLRTLLGKKIYNPNLKVMISIGGPEGSEGHSDLLMMIENVENETYWSAQQFMSSVIDVLTNEKLDGLEIHWECPTTKEHANMYRKMLAVRL